MNHYECDESVEICRTVFEDIWRKLGYNKAQHNPDYCVTTKNEEDFVMIQEVVTGTNIVYYMMIVVGVIGVVAKIANHVTLRRLLTAASGMSKSTHKLIKLVRAKYEHACMLHDKVENTRAFVEKYIYEYRGALFRIHTWRQIELQSVWFAGILAVIGAFCWYSTQGVCEEVYQYLMVGAAEMITLYVVSQLSDEPYKMEAVKNYMVDYLDNVSMFRYRKNRQTEREQIDVIRTAGNVGPVQRDDADLEEEQAELSISIEGEPHQKGKGAASRSMFKKAAKGKGVQEESDFGQALGARQTDPEEEPLYQPKHSAYKEERLSYKENRPEYKEERSAGKEDPSYRDTQQPSLREEQLRQILEEFLA